MENGDVAVAIGLEVDPPVVANLKLFVIQSHRDGGIVLERGDRGHWGDKWGKRQHQREQHTLGIYPEGRVQALACASLRIRA